MSCLWCPREIDDNDDEVKRRILIFGREFNAIHNSSEKSFVEFRWRHTQNSTHWPRQRELCVIWKLMKFFDFRLLLNQLRRRHILSGFVDFFVCCCCFCWVRHALIDCSPPPMSFQIAEYCSIEMFKKLIQMLLVRYVNRNNKVFGYHCWLFNQLNKRFIG